MHTFPLAVAVLAIAALAADSPYEHGWVKIDVPASIQDRARHTAVPVRMMVPPSPDEDPVPVHGMVFYGGMGDHFPGGYNASIRQDTVMYTVETDSWEVVDSATKYPDNERRPGTVDHGAVMDPIRQRMIVYGGRLNDREYLPYGIWALYVVSPAKWILLDDEPGTADNPKPLPLLGHSMVNAEGRSAFMNTAVIFGGFTGHAYTSDTWLLRYDSQTPRWTHIDATGDVPSPRAHHTAAMSGDVEGRMIIMGGRDGSKSLGDIFVLELLTSRWSKLESIATIPQRERQSTLTYGTSVWLFGGVVCNPAGDKRECGTAFSDFTEYKVREQKSHRHETWDDSYPPGRGGASLVVANNDAFLFGGGTYVTGSTEYDSYNDMWKWHLDPCFKKESCSQCVADSCTWCARKGSISEVGCHSPIEVEHNEEYDCRSEYTEPGTCPRPSTGHPILRALGMLMLLGVVSSVFVCCIAWVWRPAVVAGMVKGKLGVKSGGYDSLVADDEYAYFDLGDTPVKGIV